MLQPFFLEPQELPQRLDLFGFGHFGPGQLPAISRQNHVGRLAVPFAGLENEPGPPGILLGEFRRLEELLDVLRIACLNDPYVCG